MNDHILRDHPCQHPNARPATSVPGLSCPDCGAVFQRREPRLLHPSPEPPRSCPHYFKAGKAPANRVGRVELKLLEFEPPPPTVETSQLLLCEGCAESVFHFLARIELAPTEGT